MANKNIMDIKQLITFAAMFKKSAYILVLALILSVTSCSNFNKLVKSGTPEEKYEAAQKYYTKADYYHALQLYEELIVLYRGNDKIKDIYYNYAYSHYYEKDYILASYHFKYFAKTFSRDEKAEDALYMSAFCKYLLSASYNLDQESTIAAIEEMQIFINQYPESKKIEKANLIIDELRSKILKKDFEIAKLYYQTDYYLAAISALNQHIKDYPSSPYKEECMYLIIKVNYDYATKSVITKQKERFTNAISAYNDYAAKYSTAQHSKEAMKIFRSAQIQVKRIDNKLI